MVRKHEHISSNRRQATPTSVEAFTTEEQQLFVQSFQAYLQYDGQDDAFVIELDKVCEWMGFNKIGNAKRFLMSKFEEHRDYIIHKCIIPPFK